jgi:hypothetical protein
LNPANAPLIVPSHFNGPPDSGNGGYVCGLLGRRIGGSVEVRLHQPPPLDRPLDVREEDGALHAWDGATRIATARATRLRMDVPEPPSLADAEVAAAAPEATAYHPDHPFPSCFVCGPAREAGDGLRIFPGPVAGREVWATPWVPPAAFANGDGVVLPEVVWAALDCPSAMPVMSPRPIVLGTLSARRLHDVRAGETYRILSWPIAHVGRKRTSGVALFDGAEELVAAATAVWVELA